MKPTRTNGESPRHPLCRECTHYHVTWDPDAPHGCSAFGFKTPRRPSEVVYEISGSTCELFRERTTETVPGAR